MLLFCGYTEFGMESKKASFPRFKTYKRFLAYKAEYKYEGITWDG